MKCRYCNNDARYVDEAGILVCSLCPIKEGCVSAKIKDLGHALPTILDLLDIIESAPVGMDIALLRRKGREVREIIGRGRPPREAE